MIALPLGAPRAMPWQRPAGWRGIPSRFRPPIWTPTIACACVPNALLRWPFERTAGRCLRGPGSADGGRPAIARAAVLDGAGIGYFIEADVAEDIAAGRMVRLLAD
ncbi:hypothetical protein [Rhodobacter capsulatus]|uniref:hypothetical protein n=1 Tax=Rhodobacter capsulatus TaxID=1061 RepID=UPI004025F747